MMGAAATRETLDLKRDCEVIEIPSGMRAVLSAGTQVLVTQALGGSYTLITDQGALVRLDGRNADAIGREVEHEPFEGADASQASDPAWVEARVWEQLKKCYDPEIPVDIVELGLIYDCRLESRPQGGFRVRIEMTLTAPGCGMGPVLQAEVEDRLRRIPGVAETQVEVVLDPPWSADRMSEAARLALNLF